MYIEASSPRQSGEIAKLVVTVPNNGNESCLSFYYHMYGASAGTLNVYSGKFKVFTVTGNQGDNWLAMVANLDLDGVVSKTLPFISTFNLPGTTKDRILGGYINFYYYHYYHYYHYRDRDREITLSFIPSLLHAFTPLLPVTQEIKRKNKN